MKHCEVIIPEFGTRLKAAMKKKNITQKELAVRLKISKRAVHCWCCDMYLPGSGYLKIICNLLDVSADYLLELNDEM